jgi:uncharacterized membrane protein YwaF
MRQFSTPHLAALAVLELLAPLAVAIGRRCEDRVVTVVYRALAVAILCGWAGEYVADVVQGIWTVRYDLPLQLTDVIAVVTAVALWTRNRRAAEFVYLLSLSASLQATLTPGAPLRVFAATLAWVAIAAAGDLLTGGNYMYLRSKPVHGSLLDALGPWPWYLVAIGAVGLAMLAVLQAIANFVARRDHLLASDVAGATAAVAGSPAH